MIIFFFLLWSFFFNIRNFSCNPVLIAISILITINIHIYWLFGKCRNKGKSRTTLSRTSSLCHSGTPRITKSPFQCFLSHLKIYLPNKAEQDYSTNYPAIRREQSINAICCLIKHMWHYGICKIQFNIVRECRVELNM